LTASALGIFEDFSVASRLDIPYLDIVGSDYLCIWGSRAWKPYASKYCCCYFCYNFRANAFSSRKALLCRQKSKQNDYFTCKSTNGQRLVNPVLVCSKKFWNEV